MNGFEDHLLETPSPPAAGSAAHPPWFLPPLLMLLFSATRSTFPESCARMMIFPTPGPVRNSPFFVFETPTLSDHSKDLGDEFSDVAAGNRGRCSSCGGGTGGDLESRTRARSPRRKAAGRNGQRSNNDTSPPACYREHFRLQQQQGERNKGVPPSRRGYGANNVSSSAAAAGKRQARRAASLLYSSLRFVAAVRSETLPPGEFLGRK